jgi:hypothetical protein
VPLQNYRKRTRCLILVLFLLFAAGLIPPSTQPQTVIPPTVFEVELPDFQLPPSSQPEITIPSPSVSQLFVHVLKPAADGIDYGLIRTSLNGQAAAPISDIVNGARGKVVKLDLNRFPGFEFVTGRNTVEVWAQNRRGRTFYSSFVIKTVNSSWNEDFTYETQVGAGSKVSPPRVVLLEPQRAVELSPAKKTMTVRINGIATSEGEITRVAVDGKNVQFKLESKAASRQLTRVSDSERSVTFETIHSVQSFQTHIVMEVEDRAGSRTRVLIPVVSVKNKVATPVNGKKYALIIGISKYRNNLRGIANLEFADADAKSIYEFLQKPAAGGFAREDMLYLTNEQATNVRIRDALTNFVSKPGTEDLLLIFFAGHGAPDPFGRQNLYIITHDTNIDDMPGTAIPMTMLRGYIDRNVRSKRVVLLMDACHSAGLSSGARDLGNNLSNLYLQKWLYQEEGRAIITSSDVNEISRESQRWGNGHGVFTFYVLQGLKGDADANRDRFVSVGELFRYVRQKVRSETNSEQNPRMLPGTNENLALSVAMSQ